MKHSLIFLLLLSLHASAQKPFQEGVIIYSVTLQSADRKEMKGTYTFTIKGNEIKKELKLNNGYNDIILLNCSTGTAYSLQAKNGKKYAIQLNMRDLEKKQAQFAGFIINNEQANSRSIAGMAAYKGSISYKDGVAQDIYYTKEWSPAQGITFERFPNSKFLPLGFSYTDENGITLRCEAIKIEAGPVENAVFRIPPDYKMISYKEYRELSQ